MDLVTIFAIALGLAMDAFAVSIGTSVGLGKVSGRQVFRLAFHFGLFQALMPLIGWAAGTAVEPWIRAWDHWLAFGLLVFVGGRAIWGALHETEEEGAAARPRVDPTRGWSLMLLSVATSIDALAVGISFAALRVRLLLPVLVIGLVAGGLTLAGMKLGSRLGRRFGRSTEVLGGVVLLAIGLKILAEHTLG